MGYSYISLDVYKRQVRILCVRNCKNAEFTVFPEFKFHIFWRGACRIFSVLPDVYKRQVAGLALSAVNEITKEPIAKAEETARLEA